jgi:CheY-like chemotaxis protein
MNMQDILVVDNDDNISSLLQELLSEEGHRVTVAQNGQEALDLVAERLPDLILTDLDMPLVNGYELCRRIKTNHTTRLLPVLVITLPECLRILRENAVGGGLAPDLVQIFCDLQTTSDVPPA